MIGQVEVLPVLRSDAADGGLGIASIEAWPAVGGGLLVGMAEPEFTGAAALRRTVKTVFVRIGAGGGTTLLLPYMSLEAEAARCIGALVAAELAMPEACIAVVGLEESRHRLIDLGREAERGLQACAAVVRTLLLTAAAELWGAPVHRVRLSAGLIVGPERGQIVQFGDVAADAALLDVPDSVRLSSGRNLSLRAVAPTPRQHRCHRLETRESMQRSLQP
jgi:hypothetical protein